MQIKESKNNENKIEQEINKNDDDIIIKDELSNGIIPNKLIHIFWKQVMVSL